MSRAQFTLNPWNAQVLLKQGFGECCAQLLLYIIIVTYITFWICEEKSQHTYVKKFVVICCKSILWGFVTKSVLTQFVCFGKTGLWKKWQIWDMVEFGALQRGALSFHRQKVCKVRSHQSWGTIVSAKDGARAVPRLDSLNLPKFGNSQHYSPFSYGN